MCESKCSKSSEISNPDNIKIAGKLKIKDWNDLKEKLEPENDEYWCDAFSYFEKRIETRYLNPIRCIQNLNLNLGEGFAMVNLQCSLIETIESFCNGWIYQHPIICKNGKQAICPWVKKNVNNERIFISFFKYREPFKGIIDGTDFYIRVRCALLHETQTKGGWIIKKEHEKSDLFFELKDNRKIIYRNNFQFAIEEVIQKYKLAILEGKQYGEITKKDLRENFIAKFEHICKIS